MPDQVSLRLRLTLWYSSVLAIVLAIFGAMVYGILILNLRRQLDTRLSDSALLIVQSAAEKQGLTGTFLDFSQVGRFDATNIFAQVWRADGLLVVASENIRDYTQPLDAAALGQAAQTWSEVRLQDDNAHLRVFTLPIVAAAKVIGHVQVASSLASVDFTGNVLAGVLVVGGGLAVAVAGIIGWGTTDRALSPLETITQTALQITRADDLSRRIPLSPNAGRDEIGRLTQAFNESLERLERLFNAQRRFLADVSHELRTPLTAIRGNVDLLRRMGGTDAMSLDAIQSEAERMSRLVGDLLLLAQADSGNLPVARNLVEVDTLLLEVCRQAQVLANGVTVSIGEIDQAAVIGDQDRIKQLLLNLVSNALKFTPEGGRITLGLAQVYGWARLTVTDTGLGIPVAELPHIFERFYRVDKARSRALGGAGLGLSIAQRIVHLHGGKIEVASEGVPGRGTTFTILLPLAPAKSAITTPPPPKLSAADTKPPKSQTPITPQ